MAASKDVTAAEIAVISTKELVEKMRQKLQQKLPGADSNFEQESILLSVLVRLKNLSPEEVTVEAILGSSFDYICSEQGHGWVVDKARSEIIHHFGHLIEFYACIPIENLLKTANFTFNLQEQIALEKQCAEIIQLQNRLQALVQTKLDTERTTKQAAAAPSVTSHPGQEDTTQAQKVDSQSPYISKSTFKQS